MIFGEQEDHYFWWEFLQAFIRREGEHSFSRDQSEWGGAPDSFPKTAAEAERARGMPSAAQALGRFCLPQRREAGWLSFSAAFPQR